MGHPTTFEDEDEDAWTQSADVDWLKSQSKKSGPVAGDGKYKAGAKDFLMGENDKGKLAGSAINAYKRAIKHWAAAKDHYLKEAHGLKCKRARRCSPECKEYETYRKYHRKKYFKWHSKKYYKWHNKKFFKDVVVHGWKTVHSTKNQVYWSKGKAPQCKTEKKYSHHAGGIVRVPQSPGYTMVGGGVSDRYRKFNKLSGFEENYPDGNNWRCDSGFGPGRLHCYSQMCKLPKTMSCTTRSKCHHGRGIAIAVLPAGYVMTSGGVVNHHRHFDAKAAFEKTMPRGDRAWQCDIGLGGGRFTCYVRGCKATKQRLSCVTRSSAMGNWHDVKCPKGYSVMGCGIKEKRRKWDRLSAFESVHSFKNGCSCDS